MRGLATHVLDQRLLAHQQDLADRRGLGVRAEERVLAGGAVDRGRLEQLPAVEDRLRVDARGAAAGRADLEQHVRRLRARGLADAAEHRAGDDARARAQLLDPDVLAVEAEDLREVGLEARAAVDLAGALEQLLLAAGAAGLRALRVREQALLGGGGAARRAAAGGLAGGGLAALGRAHRGGGGGRGRLGVLGRQRELAGDGLARRRALAGRGVGLGDLGQARVRVGVAVDVLELDEAAEALALADAR